MAFKMAGLTDRLPSNQRTIRWTEAGDRPLSDGKFTCPRSVIGSVTRIPQGFDGCSADAACWIAFCRCSLKFRLAVGAAEWMLGDGAA